MANEQEMALLHQQIKQKDDMLLMMKTKTKDFIQTMKNEHAEALNVLNKSHFDLTQVSC